MSSRKLARTRAHHPRKGMMAIRQARRKSGISMQGKLGNKEITPKDSHGIKLGDHLLLVTSSNNKTEHRELNAGKGKLVCPVPIVDWVTIPPGTLVWWVLTAWTRKGPGKAYGGCNGHR